MFAHRIASERARRHPHREGPGGGARPSALAASAAVIEHCARRQTLAAAMLCRPAGDDRSVGRSRLRRSALVTGLGLDVIFPVLPVPYGDDGTVQACWTLPTCPISGAAASRPSHGQSRDEVSSRRASCACHLGSRATATLARRSQRHQNHQRDLTIRSLKPQPWLQCGHLEGATQSRWGRD